MKTVVIYESMYGNTHRVADAIAAGVMEAAGTKAAEAVVVAAGGVTADVLDGADLVVVGAPTHVHSLPSATTRKGAVADAPKKGLELEADAAGAGVRDWLSGVDAFACRRAAAFDTRVDASALLTGRASKAIASRLRAHGFTLVAEPESFLVDRSTHLVEGELERARRWGEHLAHARMN